MNIKKNDWELLLNENGIAEYEVPYELMSEVIKYDDVNLKLYQFNNQKYALCVLWGEFENEDYMTDYRHMKLLIGDDTNELSGELSDFLKQMEDNGTFNRINIESEDKPAWHILETDDYDKPNLVPFIGDRSCVLLMRNVDFDDNGKINILYTTGYYDTKDRSWYFDNGCGEYIKIDYFSWCAMKMGNSHWEICY